MSRHCSNSTLTPSPSSLFTLVVRQQPCKARLCSFKEKVDRRPIDPPPIIQLTSNSNQTTDCDEFLQNPYFFLYATLTDASGDTDLHFVNGNRTTAGTVVQSLHKLKDGDNTDGGFFIFSDISVRLEGFYRLKFTLYEIEGQHVNRMCSIVSDIFQVYSPKSFPGMSESTFLTRSFSDQGVRIRIRKEPRSSSSNTTSCSGKKRRKGDDTTNDSEEDEYSSIHMETSPMPRSQQNPHHLQPHYQTQPQPYYGRSPSPLPEPYLDNRYNDTQSDKSNFERRPTLPSPKEIFRSSAMSMQNILSDDTILIQQQQASVLFPPTPMDEELNHNSNSRLFATRILPLPLPSSSAANNTSSTTNTLIHNNNNNNNTIHPSQQQQQHINHHTIIKNETSWLPQPFSFPPPTTSSPTRR